jgi:hypothetical protein
MPDSYEQPADLGALTWRVRTLEERQREEHDQMTVAIDKVRHEQRDGSMEIREELRRDYLTRDQIQLSYPSIVSQQRRGLVHREWGLVIVGLLAATNSILTIVHLAGG